MSIISTYRVAPGKAAPLGASFTPYGVNFGLFSRNATSVSLLVFDDPQASTPVAEIVFDPLINRTGDVWHILVRNALPGLLYLYQVDGPFEPRRGFRFNKNKFLLDPYARALTGGFKWDFSKSLGYDPDSPERDLSFSEECDASIIPKCIVIDEGDFDWQGDRPLNIPLRDTIIYESHVKSLSAHSSSSIAHPGTYRGVIEMIPYLKSLGITSLEVLPIQEFDEFEYQDRSNPMTGEALKNFWGYSTLAFFAPKSSYAADGANGQQVFEFKEMVRELHKAGIEIILDIVFNHTGEGNELGYSLSFKGIDNPIYYMLDRSNPRYYMNYSGCGNTLNCNHPVVRNFILDCLRYWVLEMHVDGFRFDLGSILGRDEWGSLMHNPPTLQGISEDPVLRNTKIIAEAWDAGGAYQVGSFPGGRWAEWNDRFRDDMRRFWRGDPGMLSAFATRFSGSSDLYADDGRKPFHSINFICSHDGFTLNDTVSYNEKHNFLNGENNRDGHGNNLSYNRGTEGETRDEEILELRNRAVKGFFATLLLSVGTPMILGGDEFRRTQFGNNNAYCQDNEISWYDYGYLKKHGDVFRFVQSLIKFRRAHPAFRRPDFFTGRDSNLDDIPDVAWFDEHGTHVDWSRSENLLSLRLDGSRSETGHLRDDDSFFIMINSSPRDQLFRIVPPTKAQKWLLVFDTARDSDFVYPEKEVVFDHRSRYMVESSSMVLLIGV